MVLSAGKCIRLFDNDGVIGLEGSTLMDKNGHASIQGEALGDLGYTSKKYGTNRPCPHSGWTWKGHVGSNNSTNTLTPSLVVEHHFARDDVLANIDVMYVRTPLQPQLMYLHIFGCVLQDQFGTGIGSRDAY